MKNGTEQAVKLWLRPESTPYDYPKHLIYDYGGGLADVDHDLLVHQAGGDEVGARVKMDEKSPLRDRSLKVWEIVPVELETGEERRVYLNLTHLSGDIKRRKLVLVALTEDNQAVPGSRLDLTLNPPLMPSPYYFMLRNTEEVN